MQNTQREAKSISLKRKNCSATPNKASTSFKPMTLLDLFCSFSNIETNTKRRGKNRWRGLILTTEEISEIEDKGPALSGENPGIRFLTHLAVLLSLTHIHTHTCTHTQSNRTTAFSPQSLTWQPNQREKLRIKQETAQILKPKVPFFIQISNQPITWQQLNTF